MMTSRCRSWLFLLAFSILLVVGSGGKAIVGVGSRNDINLPEKETCFEEGSCEAAEDDSCVDGHEKCSAWASKGECEANPKYMLQYCKKSCGICGSVGNFTE
jgi:hypothetical protein